MPTAYFVPPRKRRAIERLRAHGIVLEPVPQAATLSLEEFQIASTEVTPQAFENHQERTVTGQYAPSIARCPPARSACR